jgi:hypothetical protein
MPVECEAHAQITWRVWNGRATSDVLGARLLPAQLHLFANLPVHELSPIHSAELLNDFMISSFRYTILLLCYCTVYCILVL